MVRSLLVVAAAAATLLAGTVAARAPEQEHVVAAAMEPRSEADIPRLILERRKVEVQGSEEERIRKNKRAVTLGPDKTTLLQPKTATTSARSVPSTITTTRTGSSRLTTTITVTAKPGSATTSTVSGQRTSTSTVSGQRTSTSTVSVTRASSAGSGSSSGGGGANIVTETKTTLVTVKRPDPVYFTIFGTEGDPVVTVTVTPDLAGVNVAAQTSGASVALSFS